MADKPFSSRSSQTPGLIIIYVGRVLFSIPPTLIYSPAQNFPIFPKLPNSPDTDYMKITPEIKKFIEDNNSLSSRALSVQIAEQFKVDVSYKAIEPHLKKARNDAEASNAAKVEAVRAKILDDADAYAGKYLKIMDEEIDAWKILLKEGVLKFPDGEKIQICDIKDRQAASQSMHKYISTVIEFVKPESERIARCRWLRDVPAD